MKRTIFIFSLLFLLSGCWDKTELEDLAIISAIGVDQIGKEKVQVFLQIVKPVASSGGGSAGGGSSEGKQTTYIVQGAGKTMAEAIAHISFSSPRRLFLGQTKVIIFGKNIRKNGIKPTLDWIERVYGIRFNNLIFTTKEDLNKLMVGKFALGSVSFFTLGTMNKLKIDETSPYTPPLAKFINSMLLPGHISYAGELGLKGKSLTVKGLGIFHKGFFIKALNREQMMDLMSLNNYASGRVIPIPCSNKAKLYTTIRIEKEKTTYTTNAENGKPRIDFTIKVEGLVESTQCEEKLTEDKLKDIEKQLNTVLQKKVTSIINMAQKDLKIDFIGFGDKLKRKDLSAWREVEKNWDTIFPSVQSNVKVISTIRGVELTTDPILPNETTDSE